MWPFPGPIIIPEGERGHLIYKWCYLGLIDGEEVYDVEDKLKDPQFDWDTYKILVNYLLKPDNKILIRNFPHFLH